MLRLWSEKDHRDLDYMFYFNMQDISLGTNPTCLEDLLFHIYCEPEQSKEEVLQDIKNSDNVVIIFDGVTDLSNLVAKKLLSHDLIPDAKIVITCRPEVQSEVFLTDCTTDWFRVEVKGFCDESIRAYLTKMLSSHPDSLISVLNNLELFSLCHVPMYALMLVACMYSTPEASEQPWTTTTMYIYIFCHCIQRHSGKQLKDPQCLGENRENVLYLAEIAFKATEQKTMNLASLSLKEGSVQFAFLGALMVKVGPTASDTYSAFLHYTMQEFFGALWLLQNPDKISEVLENSQTEEWRHIKYLVPFLCGLLNVKNICLIKSLVPASQIKRTSDWFFKKLVNALLSPKTNQDHADGCATEVEVDLRFLCQCLYESQSPEACLLLLEKLDYYLDLSGEHLDPHHCCAVSYVINQSLEKKVDLDLDSCTVSNQGLRLILGALKNVSSLGSEPSLLCEFWITLLQSEVEMDFTSLLGLCGNDLHLPVQGESRVFERAEDVMKKSLERVNLCLHWGGKVCLSEAFSKTILECLPNINKLSFARLQDPRGSPDKLEKEKEVLLYFCFQAAVYPRESFQRAVNHLLSMFSVYQSERYDILLDLYSYVKDKGNQTGRSVLLSLTPLYQPAPVVWSIDLSERKTSLLLEVLKLQPEKKLVELKGWSDEESEVRSFLQCLPYISQLRFCAYDSDLSKQVKFLVDLLSQAAEWEEQTGETTLNLVSSVCTFSTFPFHKEGITKQSDFLLDLYSHVKDYETQTGRSVLPALQSVYQSASPAVWYIDLSKRKSSILLEILKIPPEKKPVELTGCSYEESEVRCFLQCLPYISQLRFDPDVSKPSDQIKFLVDLLSQAAEWEEQTGETTLNLVSSVCTFSTFPFSDDYFDDNRFYQSDFLLDLYSHVKDYETLTGRSVLPALQSIYQSASFAVWSIDLSERKTSVLLEVLKLQPEKKLVELTGWSDEESEVRCFLQCLPYISQLSFSAQPESIGSVEVKRQKTFLLNLCLQAALRERENLQTTIEKVLSLTNTYYNEKLDFLLDLYSHVKDYGTQTGRSVLPALQPVYQSAPAVWSIDLSKRKTSVLLEVLKLQPEKKPVELTGWSDKESEVRCFLQCLPYISQLSFSAHPDSIGSVEVKRQKIFLLNLCLQAALDDRENLQTIIEKVLSLSNKYYNEELDFLLDLYSHVKDYETQTGRSVLPALQPVYQSAPAVWSIDLSERKTSVLLEVLKFQPEKKPVELIGWSDEESEVRCFLQCLPYISQLSCDDQFFLCLCEPLSMGSEWETQLCAVLLHAVDHTVVLSGWLPSVTCRRVGAVLSKSASGEKLNVTLIPEKMSFHGATQLFQQVKKLHKLRLNEMAVLKLSRTARFSSCCHPTIIEEMMLDLSIPAAPGVLHRVISSLASLLRFWPVKCLDLTDCPIDGYLLTALLCHQGHWSPGSTFRLNRESLRQLADVVNDAQDQELTQCFLEKCGHDLSYCTLKWEVLQYLSQSTTQQITVNLRKSQFQPGDIIHLLPSLKNIHFKRINSHFERTALREIHKQRAGHMVTTLLRSSDEWINLSNLVLDHDDCEALRFALHYSDGVKLNLFWTVVPKAEMGSILSLLNRICSLRVNRELLLELFHACRRVGLQRLAEVPLMRLLDHQLDLSCSSAMDRSRHEEDYVLKLSTRDCMVIALAIQVADCGTDLNLHDCQVENAGLEELIPVLHRVHLSIGKQLLLQFLQLISSSDSNSSVKLAFLLSRALGKKLDLSQTPLDLVACSSLALVLEYSEGLLELDLHSCNLTDNHLNCLLTQLHKVQVLNLSYNEVTNQGAIYVNKTLSINGFTGTVCKVIKSDCFSPDDKRHRLCPPDVKTSKRFSKVRIKALIKEFDPVMEVVEGRISYSFQFVSRGRFKCTATGLIFGMREAGTIEYRVEDWDMHILANTSYVPAGPLFHLNCPNEHLYQLQLPHCETDLYSAEDLEVAHLCINNMEFLRPKNVTESHVIVAICRLSRFGNVRKRRFDQNRVQVKVGLFLEPDATPKRQRLWVFLLPRNVPVTEVKEQHKEYIYIKTSPYCTLRHKNKYSLTSNLKLGFKVQPKKYTLHFDSSTDHLATFEVFLNRNITELKLKIMEKIRKKTKKRWSRLVILKTKPESEDSSSAHPKPSTGNVTIQKLSENDWLETLCKILEELTDEEMSRMKFFMMNIRNRPKISKSTLEKHSNPWDVAQVMVNTWGMNDSILATEELLEKSDRRDRRVTSLLQPFLKQCHHM